MVKVIGISGISGAGKTTLVKQLASTLAATTVFWDDFDSLSQGPDDYVEWYHSSGNCDDWKYDALVDVLKRLKNGDIVTCSATQKILKPTALILFDAPMGYSHKATGQFIDFLICLDTPLDIALARRLLRDYKDDPQPTLVIDALEYYLSHSRPLFILTPEVKHASDLIVDGSLSIAEQESIILEEILNLDRMDL
jgi:uridine kinase